MKSPDWDCYAIGYGDYLMHCVEDDLYFRTGVCNLQQIKGSKAGTLFWQYLLMGERVLNESVISDVRVLDIGLKKVDELKIDREQIKRLDEDPLSKAIWRLWALRKKIEMFDRIQTLKAKMRRQ